MNINNRVLQSLINALSCLMNVLIDMTFTESVAKNTFCYFYYHLLLFSLF